MNSDLVQSTHIAHVPEAALAMLWLLTDLRTDGWWS